MVLGGYFARGVQRWRPYIVICYFWLLCAANDVALGIRFVGVCGLDAKVLFCCDYDFIEERIGDIASAEYSEGQEEGFEIHSRFPWR